MIYNDEDLDLEQQQIDADDEVMRMKYEACPSCYQDLAQFDDELEYCPYCGEEL